MGGRFIENGVDITVPDANSTDNVTMMDVIGNKTDTSQIPSNTTSIVSIIKKIYDVVIAIFDGSDPLQVAYIDVISPANAGDTTLLTADGNVIIESVIVQANSSQTNDMTSCGVYGGTNNVLTIINHKDGKQINLNAPNKQVGWGGHIHISHGNVLVMEHVGTGNTVLDLTVSVIYRGKII